MICSGLLQSVSGGNAVSARYQLTNEVIKVQPIGFVQKSRGGKKLKDLEQCKSSTQEEFEASKNGRHETCRLTSHHVRVFCIDISPPELTSTDLQITDQISSSPVKA